MIAGKNSLSQARSKSVAVRLGFWI